MDGRLPELPSHQRGRERHACPFGERHKPHRTHTGARRTEAASNCSPASPWKAGQETSPWHDVFDLDHGHVRYFGDHKPTSTESLGGTRGNAALLDAWRSYSGQSLEKRVDAPPLLLFRGTTVSGAVKGYVEFCGVGVLERLERVVQRDPSSGRSFANYVYDVAVLDLSPGGEFLDWRWINDRRNPNLTAEEALRHAPPTWRRWIEEGDPLLPRLRRRVAVHMVRPAAQQRPEPGSPEERVLVTTYRHFEGRKHLFELLAARVAGNILRGRGAVYKEGWLTRGSGDGGTDFVGRLDVGSEGATAPLVVLGQAKCIAPKASINAENIARVVCKTPERLDRRVRHNGRL